MAAQKPPPGYVKDAGANVLTDAGAPSAWLQRVGEGEEQTVVSEPLALVPLVSELMGPGAANSVLGAPPPHGLGVEIWECDAATGARVRRLDQPDDLFAAK